MRYCLNPGNPHKHADLSAASLTTHDILSGEQEQSLGEYQATCRCCKYLLAGALLGDCRVTRWLGSGTFGDVYEAEQLPPLRRRVALKVMSLDHVIDGKASEIFAREVSVIATLDHPHIMPVLRVGTLPDSRPYLVMKFAAHGSLQKFCHPLPPFTASIPTDTPPSRSKPVEQQTPQQSGKPTIPLPVPSAEEIAHYHSTRSLQDEHDGYYTPVATPPHTGTQEHMVLTVEQQAHLQETPSLSTATFELLTARQLLPYLESAADALQYAHEHGIIHLDVKPANLLLDAENRLMLADFGVSTLLEGYTHASLRGYVGTPLYTAPEQWLEQPRAASDQYALAVTCYQLLTGRVPFMGNLYTIMHGHIQEAPPALRTFQEHISPEVEAVILRALAKDPAARYPDMRSFALAYRTALEDTACPIASGVSITSFAAVSPSESDGARYAISASALTEAAIATPTVEAPSPHIHARRPMLHLPRGMKRTLPLLLLALLLLFSGTLGATYAVNSCAFGSCSHPTLQLSGTTIHLLNDESQTLQLRNTGKSDQRWSATLEGNASWLTLSSTSGLLHAGQSHPLIFSSHSDILPNGSNTALVVITGPGLSPQYVAVTMQVQNDLNAVHVRVSGTNFMVQQGSQNLPTQTITLTNNSGQPLSWWSMYSQQSWLVVSPDQGILANNATTHLNVTINAQGFAPDTYIAQLTLLGKLPHSNVTSLTDNALIFTLTVTAAPSLPSATVPSPISISTSLPRPTSTPTPAQSTGPAPAGIPTTPTPNTPQVPSYAALPLASNTQPTTLRAGHSMAWDENDGLLYMFGGIDDDNDLQNDLWSYNPTTNVWKQLSSVSAIAAGNCASIPTGRLNAALVWDTLDQQLILYGGTDGNGHYFGDLWSYTPTTHSWNALQCSNNPPGPRVSGAVWTGHQMLLLDGLNANGLLTDFWAYTPGAHGGWLELATSTPPGPRSYSSLAWDSQDNRLYLFGGTNKNATLLVDLWSYTGKTGWSQINATGATLPAGREQAMMTWDSTHNVLLLMGGWMNGQSTPDATLWAFLPTQNSWNNATPTDSNGNALIPARAASAIIWSNKLQRALIYAGTGGSTLQGTLHDLWELL